MSLLIQIRKQARPGHWLALSLLFACLLAACDAPAEATPSATLPAPTATTSPTKAEPSATAEAGDQATPVPQDRDESTSYAVQPGDTLSGIAATFGLQPETLLWANFHQLRDNPDWLTQDMQLEILPVDGVYHQVGGGETLSSIASFFASDVEAIINWPGNQLEGPDPVILNGQFLLVPGGQRASRWRWMPNVPRGEADLDIPEFGSGACPAGYNSGLIGDGVYTWPVSSRQIAAEAYDAVWHPGVDLAVDLGEEVQAADDGVVVFSGWSNLGYGYLVMLDHGNGDYSLYAGLGEVQAACGRELAQGEVLGLGGISNHPAGPFLHFEIRRGAQFLDPLSLLPAD